MPKHILLSNIMEIDCHSLGSEIDWSDISLQQKNHEGYQDGYMI